MASRVLTSAVGRWYMSLASVPKVPLLKWEPTGREIFDDDMHATVRWKGIPRTQAIENRN